MHIVLFEPEIPQNTGNIARTCAATGAKLHLIEPLGFSIDEKHLKRAGLDYWPLVELEIHPDFGALLMHYPNARFYFASTKAAKCYTDVVYQKDDFIVFGPETRGLPESLLSAAYEKCIRIPMRGGIRSLNLSNSVAVVLYEALRQQGFHDMHEKGKLTGRPDKTEDWMNAFKDGGENLA